MSLPLDRRWLRSPIATEFYRLTKASCYCPAAAWSSPEARRAHNPQVAGSNPVAATTDTPPRMGLLSSTARVVAGTDDAVPAFDLDYTFPLAPADFTNSFRRRPLPSHPGSGDPR